MAGGGGQVKALTAVLVVGCLITALFSFSQTRHLMKPNAAPEQQPDLDQAVMQRLKEFPSNLQSLEKRLVGLEQKLQDFKSDAGKVQLRGGGGKELTDADSGTGEDVVADDRPAASDQAKPEAKAEAKAPAAANGKFARFRADDTKCGKMVDLLPDGEPVECNPTGKFPCCSAMGWCGASEDHCNCEGCVNYAPAKSTKAPSPAPGLPEPKPGMPPVPSLHGGTVVVIIPFRDREPHLVNFKKYWRWFAQDGNSPLTVTRWEIYVMEQFDSATFNRGWNFNAGLAIAAAMKHASPDIQESMKVDFKCAVIQDIDYLPEQGVDYADCAVPMQLSSEIDRYNWKTPYMLSAGGIVGMSMHHWEQINGFGNNYFGWGGEDDELHHRLRLNNLLYGDCYPHCGKNDKHKGKSGVAIKRPKKGHGRFSGKFMHSANHTKRITDSRAYEHNMKQLREIQNDNPRWKKDGLSNLAFRILSTDVDDSDREQYGVTYHHVRVHRGKEAFSLDQVGFAVPHSLCRDANSGWSVGVFGQSVPWDLAALRKRAEEVASKAVDDCKLVVPRSALNFIVLDRRKGLAKILSDETPNAFGGRLLPTYYRSMHRPKEDGLIIADPRPADEIQKAFNAAGAYLAPPTDFSVCSAPLKEDGPKYSVHQGPRCSGGGWEQVEGGVFKGYAKPREGLRPISYCDNEKYWTQHFEESEQCTPKWSTLKWVFGGSFYVPEGESFCVGSRNNGPKETSFSRLLTQSDCGGEGFKHDFSFSGVTSDSLPVLSTRTLCISLENEKYKLSMVSAEVRCKNGQLFAVLAADTSGDGMRQFCVASGTHGDTIHEAGKCGAKEKFAFATADLGSLPAGEKTAAAQDRVAICTGKDSNDDHATLGIGDDCSRKTQVEVHFDAPSMADIAASTPKAGGRKGGAASRPRYTLIEEELPCFSFLCPNVLEGLV